MLHFSFFWCILIAHQPLCLGLVTAVRSVLIKCALFTLDNYEAILLLHKRVGSVTHDGILTLSLSAEFFYFWKPSGTGILAV